MSAWAVPGAKCVSVGEMSDRAIGLTRFGLRVPEGQILTIKETRICRKTGALLLVFHEIADVGDNKGWNVKRFRPVITRTQEEDVSLFRDLLVSNEVDA